MSNNGPKSTYSVQGFLSYFGSFFSSTQAQPIVATCPEGFTATTDTLSDLTVCMPIQQEVLPCPDADSICQFVKDKELYAFLSGLGFDRNNDGIISAEEVIATIKQFAKEKPSEYAQAFAAYAQENPMYATGYGLGAAVALYAAATGAAGLLKGLFHGSYTVAKVSAMPVTVPCTMAYNKIRGNQVKAIEGPKSETNCDKIAARGDDFAALVARLNDKGVRSINAQAADSKFMQSAMGKEVEALAVYLQAQNLVNEPKKLTVQ